MKKVIFRTDATQAAGTGHLMRSIALAQYFEKRGSEVCFLTAEPQPLLRNYLESQNFEVKFISLPEKELGGETDLAFLLDELKRGFEWAVLDNYYFSEKYQKAVKEACVFSLVLDDHRSRGFHCDLLLNHGLQASHFKYDGTNVHCLLAGTKYALIRQELIQGREVSQKGYKNLLVTLGGSDQEVLVQKVVDAVGLVKRSNLQVKILGSFSGSLAKKLRLVRLDSRKNIEICEPQLDLSNLYRWADLAVSAGGGTLWELCFYGVVGMVGVLSENQEAIAEALEEAGIFKSVGWYRSASSEKIADTLESLITHPEWVESTRQKALRLVDGKGAERVYEAMKRVEYENTAAYNRK